MDPANKSAALKWVPPKTLYDVRILWNILLRFETALCYGK